MPRDIHNKTLETEHLINHLDCEVVEADLKSPTFKRRWRAIPISLYFLTHIGIIALYTMMFVVMISNQSELPNLSSGLYKLTFRPSFIDSEHSPFQPYSRT